MNKPTRKISQPKVLSKRTFSVEPKEFIKAVGKGLINAARFKWEDVAIDAVEAISAIGIGTEPEALAFVLVRKSAMAAMFSIVGEVKDSINDSNVPYSDNIEKELERMVERCEMPLNKYLFTKPEQLPIVKAIQQVFATWLRLLSIESHNVAAIVARLPSYFAFSLNEQWRKNAKVYSPILEFLETPFDTGIERMMAWRAYTSWLQMEVDVNTLSEVFSLRQVYVPLRAYYEDDDTSQPAKTAKRAKVRMVVDMESELTKWLLAGKPEDAIRVVSGGPGSGKSSFAKIFAARVAANQKTKVLFIPLHSIDPSRELTEEVGVFVKEFLPYNPLDADSKESNLLIVFDGLDELANQGRAANDTARAFANEVERLVSRRNQHGVKLQVIICGRELTVQGSESEFRRPRQILTLLPYLINLNEEEEDIQAGFEGANRLSGNKKLIEKDQRQDWWKQYGNLSGHDYSGLPAALGRKDLREVTAQPLLNYLVALSFTRGELDFTKDVNLNQIYEDLVRAVYVRAYDKNKTHKLIRQMEHEQFVRVLEEIGLASWHGDGRTTTVRDIEAHCEVSGLQSLLEIFKEGAKAGVTRLLAAFFFRQHASSDARGEQTFVFTHKSFGEYLAARRIVLAMEVIADEREVKRKNMDRGWGEIQALAYWTKTTGPSATTSYLAKFISNEILLREERQSGYASRLQQHFVELFSFVLKNGLPKEGLGDASFKRQSFLSRNAEESLFVCMSICADISLRLSDIVHPEPEAFGAWFRRIQGQRNGPKSCLAANHLRRLNLKNAKLDIIDFYGVDLSYSTLQQAHLNFAVLASAKLTGTDLSRIRGQNINLQSAKFHRVNMVGAHIPDCIFENTLFDSVALKGCFMGHISNPSGITCTGDTDLDEIRTWLRTSPKSDEVHAVVLKQAITRTVRKKNESTTSEQADNKQINS